MCNAENGDKVVSNRAPYCSVQQGVMSPFVAKLALIVSIVFFAAGENGEPGQEKDPRQPRPNKGRQATSIQVMTIWGQNSYDTSVLFTFVNK